MCVITIGPGSRLGSHIVVRVTQAGLVVGSLMRLALMVITQTYIVFSEPTTIVDAVASVEPSSLHVCSLSICSRALSVGSRGCFCTLLHSSPRCCNAACHAILGRFSNGPPRRRLTCFRQARDPLRPPRTRTCGQVVGGEPEERRRGRRGKREKKEGEGGGGRRGRRRRRREKKERGRRGREREEGRGGGERLSSGATDVRFIDDEAEVEREEGEGRERGTGKGGDGCVCGKGRDGEEERREGGRRGDTQGGL
eukprot:3667487-Rhodomonas_salina.2